jgi:ketopantoate reductase
MDWLNGAVIRLGEALGLDCPTQRVILNLVRSLENSQVRCRS